MNRSMWKGTNIFGQQPVNTYVLPTAGEGSLASPTFGLLDDWALVDILIVSLEGVPRDTELIYLDSWTSEILR